MYATTITPLGLRKCLSEIASAPDGQLSVSVNPEPAGRGSGPRFDVHHAGELGARERVMHFKSAAARGLIAADPADTDQYGNRIQRLSLTPLGEEVLAGREVMPPVPGGEQAGGGEVGLSASFAAAAKATAHHEKTQRELRERDEVDD